MSLITYEDVRPWARSIKNRTGLRNKPEAMPPWYIEKDIGIQDFKNDPSLSDAEVEAIATWVDNGAPLGNPADMPPPLEFLAADQWSIGEPDLIVSSPTVEVGAKDPDWWGAIGETPTGLTEDRYVAAVEQKEVSEREPTTSAKRSTVGSNFAIHHMIWNAVNEDRISDEELERLREEDPAEFERRAAEAAGQGFWPVHEVGRNADHFDPRAGQLLKAGSRISFTSAHLHSTGSHTKTRLDIGFKFHPRGYEPEYTNSALFAGTLNIDVRGNQADQAVVAYQTLPQDAKLSLFEPHLHAAGVRQCLDAIYPNGLSETLSCSGYNHSWVRGLCLRRPCRAAASQGHHPAHHRLFRHDAGQPERGRRAQLVRSGAPLDRPDDDQPDAGHVPERRAVRARAGRTARDPGSGGGRLCDRLSAVRAVRRGDGCAGPAVGGRFSQAHWGEISCRSG